MKRILWVMAVLIVVSFMGCAKGPPKVLVVFSYSEEFVWCTEELDGLQEALGEKEINLETYYMDTKNKTDEEWKLESAENTEKKIKKFKPKVLVLFDDNACELVGMNHVGDKMSIVFAGVNNDPSVYNFPAENVTGVIERNQFDKAFELLKSLAPDVKKIAFISDESPTSQLVMARLKEAELPIELVEVYVSNDFNGWKEKIAEYQTTVDAIGFYSCYTLTDETSETSLPAEMVLKWIIDNNKLPELSLYPVEDGFLCEYSLNGTDQGKAAGEMVISILDGTKPADIPVVTVDTGYKVINEKRAAELGLTIPEEGEEVAMAEKEAEEGETEKEEEATEEKPAESKKTKRVVK